MADYNREYPQAGDTYFHPITFNAYLVHSLTDDGWVRYRSLRPGGMPVTRAALWTMPTLEFIRMYQRQEYPRV